MAITRNIVEMMNGTINVESEPGKGSVFTVEITLKLQDTEKNAEQIKELEGLRALVVDDDFNTCDSVSKMLKPLAGKLYTVLKWHIMKGILSILILLTGRCQKPVV